MQGTTSPSLSGTSVPETASLESTTETTTGSSLYQPSSQTYFSSEAESSSGSSETSVHGTESVELMTTSPSLSGSNLTTTYDYSGENITDYSSSDVYQPSSQTYFSSQAETSSGGSETSIFSSHLLTERTTTATICGVFNQHLHSNAPSSYLPYDTLVLESVFDLDMGILAAVRFQTAPSDETHLISIAPADQSSNYLVSLGNLSWPSIAYNQNLQQLYLVDCQRSQFVTVDVTCPDQKPIDANFPWSNVVLSFSSGRYWPSRVHIRTANRTEKLAVKITLACRLRLIMNLCFRR